MKRFGRQWYTGTVASYNDPYWHIQFDDGDSEDFNLEELLMGISHYQTQETGVAHSNEQDPTENADKGLGGHEQYMTNASFRQDLDDEFGVHTLEAGPFHLRFFPPRFPDLSTFSASAFRFSVFFPLPSIQTRGVVCETSGVWGTPP